MFLTLDVSLFIAWILAVLGFFSENFMLSILIRKLAIPRYPTTPKMRAAKIAFATTAVLLFVTGCASGATSITTPNGKRGFIIPCSSSDDGWTACNTAASSICQGKYLILDKFETSTPTPYGLIVSRHVVTECKQ